MNDFVHSSMVVIMTYESLERKSLAFASSVLSAAGVFSPISAEVLISIGHRKSYYLGCTLGAVGTLLFMLFDMPLLLYTGAALRGFSYNLQEMANKMWLLETYRPEEQLVGQAIFVTFSFVGDIAIGLVAFPIYFAFGYNGFGLFNIALFVLAAVFVYGTGERFPHHIDYADLD